MAISSYKTYLMKKDSSGGSYEKLVDIKSFPDLGGEPEMLETTTLSNGNKTFIAGIQSTDSMSFECNYTKADYTTVKALADGEEHEFAVWFGASESGSTVTPDGSNGKFEFKGTLSVYVTGGGVNEVVGMTITIAPSTDITIAT